MSEELKPCPHCGSKGAEVVFDTGVFTKETENEFFAPKEG